MTILANPKISVIIPSYNHANFVGEAIESVLNQTFEDFELIIIDDFSKDDSIEKILEYKDSRIKFYKNDENMGATYSVNKIINIALGNYIALLNSDDVWELDKLKKQVFILDNNKDIGAVFSNVKFINEKGEILGKDDYFWNDIFFQANRNQGKWLRRFFFELNCLCHPSVLIRKEVYNKTNLYNYALLQLCDFEMWINIVKFTQIYVLDEKLVKFRIFSNNLNASADTPINRIRNKNELYLIMQDFFNNVSSDIFIEGFSDLLIRKGELTKEEIECEKAFMFFKVESEISYIYQLIGIQHLYSLFNNQKTREVLRKSYNFTDKDFFEITGNFEIIDTKLLNISNLVMNITKTKMSRSPKILNLVKRIYKILS